MGDTTVECFPTLDVVNGIEIEIRECITRTADGFLEPTPEATEPTIPPDDLPDPEDESPLVPDRSDAGLDDVVTKPVEPGEKSPGSGPMTTMVEQPSRTNAPAAFTTRVHDSDDDNDDVRATVVPTAGGSAQNRHNSKGDESKGVAPGAVAGIAIGTAIFGAAIAFLIAFLLFKRRNRRSERYAAPTMEKYDESSPSLLGVGVLPKGAAPAAGQYSPVQQTHIEERHSIPAPTAAMSSSPTAVGAFGRSDISLPPPASDSEILETFTSLFTALHEHVSRFYRDVHATITPSLSDELSAFGAPGTDIVGLLEDVRPTSAIQHALVAYVLNTTRVGGALFPNDVVGILGSRSSGGEENDADAGEAQVMKAMYKRLSVHLHTSFLPRRSSALLSYFLDSAQHFSLTFFPWADPVSSDTERDEDLARLIEQALEKTLWLYGQGWETEWVWDTGRRGEVCVAPGLERVVWIEGGRVERREVVFEGRGNGV